MTYFVTGVSPSKMNSGRSFVSLSLQALSKLSLSWRRRPFRYHRMLTFSLSIPLHEVVFTPKITIKIRF